MKNKQVISTIGQGRVVAILRGHFNGREREIVETLFNAGIRAVEVTLNSPDALSAVKQIASGFGSKMAVGAGTVLEPVGVEQAADAGARFIVSPNCDVRVIEATKHLELVSIPGCFTPTESMEAVNAGADAVKLFPAVSLGADFVRAMQGPLGFIRLVPTGGVSPDTAREYISAGAWAIGVGSELVSEKVLLPGGLKSLTSRAAAFIEAVAG